jgi:UDP-glucose 4-epimerase
MYLITGAAGYIGSMVAQELAYRGRKVRLFDTRRPAVTGHSVEFFKGSVTDLASVHRALRDVRIVFHCSEEITIDPFRAARANSLGTLTVLEAARKADVHKVVYTSTAEVYGDNPATPWKESATPLPLSPYALTKLQGEYYCRAISSIHGLETISLRTTAIYGSGDGLGVRRPVVPNGMIDYVHISDVVHAHIAAARGRHFGESYNIGSGEKYSGSQVVSMLKAAGIQARLGARAPPATVSIARAKKDLGYAPMYPLRRGIRTLQSVS